MPRNEKSGPRATGNRSSTHQGTNDTLTVQRATDERHAVEQMELPTRYPLARVSLYEPHAGRRTWWFAYRCPVCSYGHRGELRRATDEESAKAAVQGVRRARCGPRVWLAVGKTYRGAAAGSEVAA